MSKSIRQKGQQLLERAEGCLVGLAVGDALGGPLEGFTANEIRNRYGILDEMVGGGWLNLKPGETSDDTALTEIIADSIVCCGGFDPDDIASRLAHWYQSGGKGAGYHTSKVLSRVMEGGDWEQTALETQAANPASARKGSLMRGAPVALLHFDDEELMISSSRLSSRITHPHADCQWASVFINLVIGKLLAGFGKRDAFQDAFNICRNQGNASPDVLDRALLASSDACAADLSSTSFVLDTLESSLRSWLHHDSFEASVVAAVNLGGDTDTIGAVTGALAGSTYGINSIPKRWLIYIKNRHRLQELADTVTAIYST